MSAMENKFNFGYHHANTEYKEHMDYITILIFEALMCIFGLVGNGILGFRIKRNPFGTFLLNLTVSDFGFLLSVFLVNLILMIEDYVPGLDSNVVLSILFIQDLLMYSSCQCILIVMTIDRCVAVIAPEWYYCRRSPNFPTNVCGLIWGFLFFLCGIHFYLLFFEIGSFNQMLFAEMGVFYQMFSYQRLAIVSISLLTMTISTLMLLITVCLKFQTHQHGKLSIVTLLILLFPFPFSFLSNAVYISRYLGLHIDQGGFYVSLFRSLRSSVNLLIYLLVGRWKERQVIFQKVFKEVEQRQIRETCL